MEGGERKTLKMDVTCLPQEIGNEAIGEKNKELIDKHHSIREATNGKVKGEFLLKFRSLVDPLLGLSPNT